MKFKIMISKFDSKVFAIFFICLIAIIRGSLEDETQFEMETDHMTDTTTLELCNGPGSDPFGNLAFNGQCNCKRNVQGIYCSECKPGTFDMSFNHRHGCLRCFCSGRSKSCNSSDLYTSEIKGSFLKDTDGVTLVSSKLNPVECELSVKAATNEILVHNLPQEANDTYYWKLPEKFVGDKLNSFGGFIHFTTKYEIRSQKPKESKWLKDPLMFIQGNGITLFYRFRKRNRKTSSHSLPLTGNNWFILRQQNNPNSRSSERRKPINPPKKKVTRRRKRARRQDLMKVLSNIDFIIIKANYKPMTTMVGLKDLVMSYAHSDDTSGKLATSVEHCECPRGYGGLSCQNCAEGFTKNPGPQRQQRTEQDASCYECQCNGRSNSCNPETGICIGCQNNSTGDYCERVDLQCDQRGTYSVEMDPPTCKCKARVEGEKCDRCRESYFNLDLKNEKGCKKCWCNGVALRCKSSTTLRRFQIRVQAKSAISIAFKQNGKKKVFLINLFNGKASYRPYFKYRQITKLHWSLPKIFTGNLLQSYGGHLNFSLTNTGHCESHKNIHPLIELESFYGRILRWKFSPNIVMNSLTRYSIKLIEDHFVYTFNHIGSSRSTFLEVLKDLKDIRIYVPECSYLSSTEISDIVLDTSTASAIASKNELASEVEHCECSPAYSGLSCEYCSPGYEFDSYKRCIQKSFNSYYRY